MKTTLFRIGLALFLFFGNIVYAETLHLVTQDFPPLGMRVSGEPTGNPDDPLTGISVDIIRDMFKRAGIEYTLQIYSWERAYDMALKTPGYGIFSSGRTPEREELFHWVGPLITTNWVVMAKKSRNIRLAALEDAHKYKIGGFKSGAVTLFLEKQGFKIENYIQPHLVLRKMEAEKIDLLPIPEIVGYYFAKREGVAIEPAFIIKEIKMFLALNKTVSADTVAKLNKHFQDMKNDGTLDKIYARYR